MTGPWQWLVSVTREVPVDMLEGRLPPERPDESVNSSGFGKLVDDHLTRYEDVYHVSRPHPIVLVLPFLRTVSALLVMLAPGWAPWLGLVFAFAVFKIVPLRQGWRRRLLVAVGATVLAVLVPRLGVFGLAYVLLLMAWLGYDLANWYHEILVVTNKRVMLLHGIFTVHRPSIKISSISFSNCISGLIGDQLHYGTIDLDSSSQRDGALSDIEYVPHAYHVWRLILSLHSEHRREMGDSSDHGNPKITPAPE